jgi:long-chain acyl-CoA synthetase
MDTSTPRTRSAPRNLADLLRRAAERRPDADALRYQGACMAWEELDRAVDELAAGLRGRFAPGARIALALANTPRFAIAYFALARSGLVAVPLNTGYTAPELTHLLADAGASAVFFDSTTADALAAAAPALGSELLAVDARPTPGPGLGGGPDGPPAIGFAELGIPDAPPVEPVTGAEDLAVLLYTSGTSGTPRGVMLSHRALLANLDQLGELSPPAVSSEDVVLLVLPLFHIYGLNAGLGAVAWAGATGVLVDRFDPAGTLAELRRERVTNVIGAPPMYVAWSMLSDLDGAFDEVRLAVSGSAPLPPRISSALAERTGRQVFEGYGLTEASPVVASSLMSEVAKPGSVGRPIPGVAVRIVDESGREVEEADPGEILVRGANLFSGYWPDGAGGPDGDGWFATGDLAYADPDGDLFLVGRRRDLIIVSGFNVYPAEIEGVLAGHPDIVESAAVGIPHPYTGESVKALVVARPGSGLTGEDVIAFARRSLARFKCPTAVEFVTDLPHSVAGKVARARARGGR